MRILYENEVLSDISILEKAWGDTPTFAFVPNKSGVESEWIENGLSALPASMHTDHFCLLTSGSTGKPKLIIVKKTRSEALTRVIHDLQQNEPVKHTILVLPLNYSYAFINQWLWSRVIQRGLVITSGLRDPQQTGTILSKYSDTMVCMVGAQIPLIKKHLPGVSFPGVIRLNFAGGPFPQNDIESVQAIFPNAKIFNNYGCAEAMPRLTIRPLEESPEGSNVGPPLPGIEIKADENGALIFRSPYRLSAYYNDRGLTLVEDETWIPSGDFGEVLSTGQIRVKGRANEVYKRFGEKIALPMLLKAVYAVWGGEAVFYRERDNNDEEGHVLVLSPEPENMDIRTILNQFRKQFTRIHWPLRIESVDKIPLLSNDKIDVRKLKSNDEKKEHWRQRI